jgi:Ca-activated chloride channel family protein
VKSKLYNTIRANRIILLVTCCFSLFTLLSLNSIAQEPVLTRILFIYDASNSMNGTWKKSGVKHQVAYKLLAQALDSLVGEPNLELALRAYGHTKYYKDGQDCEDTELLVPFSKSNTTSIKKAIKGISPKGTTLIAYSLEQSANDFPPCDNCRNVIILITDGIEECDGDPCAISLALQKKGIILKPFIIGIGLDVEFANAFECIGTYYDAADEETFSTALNVVISQAMYSTTSQVNLLDENGLPSESNVNMTFYNSKTGAIDYNYIHTMNHRGNPDTIDLDPVPMYKMVVHTIPKIVKDSITITAGIHNIIAVDAPQGELELKVSNSSGQYKDLQAIVRLKKDMNTLNIQPFLSKEKYITGKYDIEILCLPRLYIDDVEISQSHVTTIEIPKPGIATVLANSYGYGSIYLEKNGKLEWVTNINSQSLRETYALQPGNYRIEFRTNSAKKSLFTIERTFEIKSGSSTSVKLF